MIVVAAISERDPNYIRKCEQHVIVHCLLCKAHVFGDIPLGQPLEFASFKDESALWCQFLDGLQ